MTKNTHGGRRPNAGRKYLPYKTTTVRIPEPLKSEIVLLCNEYKQKQLNK